VDVILVDGDNLLHAALGRRDERGVTWLLPELARWRPDGLRIVVVFDGHAAPGESSRGRAARGVEYRYAGAHTADDLLIELLGERPFADRAGCLVVSSDAALAARVRRSGGLSRSVDWLLGQLASRRRTWTPGTTGGRIGRAGLRTTTRSSTPPRSSDDGEVEARGWRPGRGATRKRGNPRRSARRRPEG
jgi:predicted RNA-binding protein with PIN domain